MELIREPMYVGADLKFLVELTAPGFDMDDDDFTIELKGRSASKTFSKEDLVTDGEGNWYCCFNSTAFGAGVIQVVITAYVPDDDFEDGYRTEINKYNLINVLR